MGRSKMTKEEFLSRVTPYFVDSENPPTLEVLANATGLTVSGVRYRLDRYGIRRKRGWSMPTLN